MLFVGVLKRIIPFFLTFAAGLFIASFFINIASPSFNFPRKSHKYREMQRLRQDYERVKRENAELKQQLDEARRNTELQLHGDSDFPRFEAVPLPPPPPPAVPRVVYPKFDK